MKNTKNIELVTSKKEGHTMGHSKILDRTFWKCDLHITRDNGEVYVVPSITFTKNSLLKREVVAAAKKYAEYIRSRGDFYFV